MLETAAYSFCTASLHLACTKVAASLHETENAEDKVVSEAVFVVRNFVKVLSRESFCQQLLHTADGAVLAARGANMQVRGQKAIGGRMKHFAKTWVDTLSVVVIEFMAFSFVGWLYETVENWFSFGGIYLREQLGGPWCPIYGIGGLIMVAAALPLIGVCRKHKVNRVVEVLLVALCVGVVALVTELAGSYLCEALTGDFPWNYSGAWGNFEGRVAPLYTARFIVMGLIAAYLVAPAIEKWAAKHPFGARRLSVVLVVLLVADIVCEALGVWDPLEDKLEPFGIHHW